MMFALPDQSLVRKEEYPLFTQLDSVMWHISRGMNVTEIPLTELQVVILNIYTNYQKQANTKWKKESAMGVKHSTTLLHSYPMIIIIIQQAYT